MNNFQYGNELGNGGGTSDAAAQPEYDWGSWIGVDDGNFSIDDDFLALMNELPSSSWGQVNNINII